MNSYIENLLSQKVAGYVHDDIKNISKYELFNMGESFIAPCKKIRPVLGKFDLKKLSAYLDPTYGELRQVIADRLSVKLENILLSVGADEAIGIIPRVFGEPDSDCVCAVPTFYRIVEANIMFKINVHLVGLDEKNDFKYDGTFLDNFIAEINLRKARTAWICNPNNPTGNMMTQKQVRYILDNIDQKTILVVDEVFFDFFDPTGKKSAVNLVKKYKNLIVVRSLSKSYSLAGIRLGFVVADKSLIEEINHIKPVFNINALSEEVAKIAIGDKNYITQVANKTRAIREKLFLEIKKLKNYKIGGTSETNVFILKHKKKDLYNELKNKFILTADFRESFGLEGKGYVRITIQDEQKNKKLLLALKQID
ncbi:MAG: aminotransferase class I/II-fold pyridoxal phosphate-dependent enzyme [Parcubacteria group bacterium]|jgi:histidinol-phosphate aminotransferase